MDFILNFLPIIIGTGAAFTLLIISGGNNMEVGIWSVVVALISIAGTLIVHWFQFKKDGNRISEIKSDTSEIKPNVSGIKSKSSKIEDKIDETYKFLSNDMNPKIMSSSYKLDSIIENNKASLSSISELTDELHFQRRIRNETAGKISKDYIIEGVNQAYIELAALRQENRRLENENSLLKYSNTSLQKENASLQKQLNDIKNTQKQQNQNIER